MDRKWWAAYLPPILNFLAHSAQHKDVLSIVVSSLDLIPLKGLIVQAINELVRNDHSEACTDPSIAFQPEWKTREEYETFPLHLLSCLLDMCKSCVDNQLDQADTAARDFKVGQNLSFATF
jgi:hypothetical protein